MLDILYVWHRRPQSEGRPSLDFLSRYCMITPTYKSEWQTVDRRGTAYLFGADTKPIATRDRIDASQDGLRVLRGWMIQEGDASPARSVSTVSKPARHGEYLLIDLDARGYGSFLRDALGSVQLYVYEDAHVSILSTRASLIAGYRQNSSLSPDFARWVANYSVAATHDSIFDGVKIVPASSSTQLFRGKPEIQAGPFDFLHDPQLSDLYARDRKRYWDDVYDQLLEIVGVVDLADDGLRFPISGGKDSRLLLGLLAAAGHRDKISTTFTNGPEFSPEVRSGEIVAASLGLRHENVWNPDNAGAQSVLEVESKLLRHLFITEGEMSSADLTFVTSVRNNFTLSGQEAGLRNIAGRYDVSTREKLRKWMAIQFGDGDICGVVREAAAARCREEIEQFIDQAEAAGTPYSQVPSLHRVSIRGARWVSRVWGIYNNIGFAPQVFRSTTVTKATYNAGSESRRLEEFHYEMLRRVDPAMIGIPFAGQSWNPELGSIIGDPPPDPQPLDWPADFSIYRQRGMFGVLIDNFDSLKRYIVRSGRLRSVIDPKRLMDMREPAGPGHVHHFWQIFQCALMDQTYDFAALKDGDPLSFGIPPLAN